MASSSSENLASIESWAFRPSLADSHSLSSLFCLVNSNPLPTPTPTVSGSNVSGSGPETTLKQQRTVNPPPTGKVSKSKRKSRASKRSQTTLIKTEPANFRQMVQQVTGVRFGNEQMCPSPILKPEPQRPGYLPTLDTSSFLLDHHHHPSSGSVAGSSIVPLHSSVVADVVGSVGASLDCDRFPCFPTLESWKA